VKISGLFWRRAREEIHCSSFELFATPPPTTLRQFNCSRLYTREGRRAALEYAAVNVRLRLKFHRVE